MALIDRHAEVSSAGVEYIPVVHVKDKCLSTSFGAPDS